MAENTFLKFGKENFVGAIKGKLLDYYDIVKQLGKGGYGEVFEVKNKRTGEILACKHLSKLNIEDTDKLLKEINYLKRMDHPNIINFSRCSNQKILYI